MENGALGMRLRQLRVGRKLTQIGLAELSGVSKDTVAKLEQGQRGTAPRIATLARLAVALGVPVPDLLGERERSEDGGMIAIRDVLEYLPGTPPGSRPAELLEQINTETPHLSEDALTATLRNLTGSGFAERSVGRAPAEDRYWRTADGHTLAAVLQQLQEVPAGAYTLPGGDGSAEAVPEIRVDTPSIARVYDYVLGGKDNFQVDREAGDEFIALMPAIVTTIRAGRPVLSRMIRHLVNECGVLQFLDIGAGLPTAANTHEVAQGADPRCRVVYVDNDAMVLAHARALLTSTAEGATAYIGADLRDTAAILDQSARTLDLSQPVTIILSGILHLIPDADDPWGIVDSLVSAIPAGSYLMLAHPASDIHTGAPAATGRFSRRLAQPVTFRPARDIERFLNALDVLPPGLVQPQQWRPDPDTHDPGPLAVWCALARKP
jgi:transcriptional regulator with XRE-family HTH domain